MERKPALTFTQSRRIPNRIWTDWEVTILKCVGKTILVGRCGDIYETIHGCQECCARMCLRTSRSNGIAKNMHMFFMISHEKAIQLKHSTVNARRVISETIYDCLMSTKGAFKRSTFLRLHSQIMLNTSKCTNYKRRKRPHQHTERFGFCIWPASTGRNVSQSLPHGLQMCWIARMIIKWKYP